MLDVEIEIEIEHEGRSEILYVRCAWVHTLPVQVLVHVPGYGDAVRPER